MRQRQTGNAHPHLHSTHHLHLPLILPALRCVRGLVLLLARPAALHLHLQRLDLLPCGLQLLLQGGVVVLHLRQEGAVLRHLIMLLCQQGFQLADVGRLLPHLVYTWKKGIGNGLQMEKRGLALVYKWGKGVWHWFINGKCLALVTRCLALVYKWEKVSGTGL